MQTQEQSPVILKLFEAFNNHDIQSMLPLIADQFDWFDVPSNVHLRNKDDFKSFIQNWTTGFPDAKIEVKSQLVSGNYVVTEYIGRGTHQGTFKMMGKPIPPTNRKLELRYCDVSLLKDGKLAQVHSYFDVASLARQLGLEAQLAGRAAAA